MKKCRSKFAFRENATLVSYQSNNKKNVIPLSNQHTISAIVDGPKTKPEIIEFYNKTKSGVDLFHLKCHALTTKGKTRRWPMVYFYNVLDIACMTVHVLYHKVSPGSKLSNPDCRHEFHEQLAKESTKKPAFEETA
ncbi:PiggyBac transposable element-derived protein 4 [Elysia marginata]|uniref:PiggyBac transposable element-derived protein 4 n=1 Tax=Elysia marginata TaxID=1093978 RepID=A0AAV4I720_9GAST|nr:PiggyBac transposable element-derived protein 4 [Elysia marginata]